MELTSNLKKRFCKDFKLPITIFQEPYFTYFKELYEPLYAIEQKLAWLEKAIERAGGAEPFFAAGYKISENIKSRISNTEAYKNFNNIDMNKEYLLKEEVKQQNIYIPDNAGKNLISIDLEKANFNIFKLFNLHQELGVSSYKQLMEQETDLDYYLNSKMIRQVIFGDLNPSRQQKVQKYVINQICNKLKEAGCSLTSASSDEIIIQDEMTVEEINNVLKDIDDKFRFFRIEPFRIEKISSEREYYVKYTKTSDGEKIEFKNAPSHFFAQIYKKQFNLELHPNDMLFYTEGFLAEFKERLFEAELQNNKKNDKKLKK